jgi:DNA-binding GntR family transcriptional regulator
MRIAREMGPLIPELLDMRTAVEPKAAELAALRATDEATENLRWLADRAERMPAAERRQADSTLHIAIAHTARSDRLLDLVLEEQMRLHELLAYLSSAPGLRGEQDHSRCSTTASWTRSSTATRDLVPGDARSHRGDERAPVGGLKVDLGLQRAPAG